MSNNKIVVVGSSNTDMIIKVSHIPKPGETILGGEFVSAAGGKGANQAVGAARAGGAVTFIAKVGQDMFGEKALAGFSSDGIETRYIARDPESPSGVALIFVGEDGENSIAVASGANARLTPEDVEKSKDAFTGASVLLLQLETPLPTVQTAANLAVQSGVRVILNPAPAQSLPEALLKQVFLLTPNESEAELLTGIPIKNDASAKSAAEKLLKLGVKNVIVTLGSRGTLVANETGSQFTPAFKVKAVDTTAAGDIFNGALAVSLAEGKSILNATRFASAAAAISVTRLGAQTSAPTRKEIETLLASGRLD